jgi:CRISPR-associated endonuclease Csn1
VSEPFAPDERARLEAWLARARAAGVDVDGNRPEKARAFWENDPPRLENGPPIRRVRLVRDTTAGIKLKRGDGEAHADQQTMIRIDVFRRNGRYYVVPIYAWQLTKLDRPPMRAVKRDVTEADWYVIDESFEFLWSLYPGSLFRAVNAQGRVAEGYYRSFDRRSGQITYSPPEDWQSKSSRRLSVATLKAFEKYHVDRLGRRFRIERETRTWRGVPCS